MVTRVDRLLTHTVSLAGLTSLVVGVYLLVVIGLGRSPRDDERALLLLSMAAAAVAAGIYLPARERLETFVRQRPLATSSSSGPMSSPRSRSGIFETAPGSSDASEASRGCPRSPGSLGEELSPGHLCDLRVLCGSSR